MNSTGIALIVSLLGRARASRVLVIGRGLDEHHRHIFTITRLSDFMRIEEPDDPNRPDPRCRPRPNKGAVMAETPISIDSRAILDIEGDPSETRSGGSHG